MKRSGREKLEREGEHDSTVFELRMLALITATMR